MYQPLRKCFPTVKETQENAEIDIDRKILADIAVHDPEAFAVLAVQAKASLGASS